MYNINSVCFICLSSCTKLSAVFHKQTYNDVLYVLPELTILNSKHPLFICSSCHTTLRSYSTFKKKCLENYSRLNDSIKILQGSNATPDQSSNGLQIRLINRNQQINCENDIHLNIEEETADALMSCNEQNDQRIKIDDDIEVKEESLEPEDSADRGFNNSLMKSVSVANDIRNGGSSVLYEGNNALNKQNCQQTVVEDYIIKEDKFVNQEDLNIKLNNQGGNEDALVPWEEHNSRNIVTENNTNVEESLTSKDNADREFDQKLVCTPIEFIAVCKSESVSDDEQDGGSNDSSGDNDTLDMNETNSITDTDIQQFQCTMCKEVFTDRSTFDTHLRNHLKNIRGLKCLICDKKLSNRQILVNHIKSHLGIKDYACSICKQKFVSNGILKIHMNVHKGVNYDECSICKKKFTRSSYLKAHVKTHEDRKDHECLICKKKFSQNVHLKIHIKTHEGRKEYECSYCKKEFTHSSNLKRHVKTHEGRKDYECPFCKKKFTRRSNLKLHVNAHEGRKDFECTICKRKFSSSYYGRVHMKMHQDRNNFEFVQFENKNVYQMEH